MSARPERRLHPIAIPLACAGLFVLQVWTFRWGAITFDTTVQYEQVLSGQYEDWHPPVTAFIWRWIGGARFGTAPFLLLDCALYWTGFGLFAESLRRRGQNWAAVAAITVALLPIPFGQMGAVLKDPLLAASGLCATGLLAVSPRPAARLLAALLLIIAAAMRFNAVLAAAPLLLLAVAPDLWRRPRLLTAGGLALATAMLILSSALITAALQPRRTDPVYSLVNFDLAGASLFAGYSLYPAAADPGLALIAHCYSPRLFGASDYERCDPIEPRLRDAARAAGVGPLHVWAEGLREAPLAYAAHRLAHFNRNQRWLVQAVPDDAVYIASETSPFNLRFQARPAARLVRSAAMAMATSPLGRPATWLAAAAGLCLLGAGGRLPPLALALAASALLYGGAYAVVSVADDMRYNLWTMLAAMLAWLLTVTQGDWLSLPRVRRRLALALPLGAVLAELVALAA